MEVERPDHIIPDSAFSQRRKELALEAEVKRKEQEEVEAQARMDAERKAAKARAEREAYEKVSQTLFKVIPQQPNAPLINRAFATSAWPP